jgi:hypothetical protein
MKIENRLSMLTNEINENLSLLGEHCKSSWPSKTSFHKQNLALLGYYVSGSPCLLCVPEVGLLYLLQLRTPNLSSGPKIKLKGIKLRDREGHRIGPLRPIQRFGYLRFK